MPFKDGIYKHEKGFEISVSNGKVFVSSGCPLSMRLSEFFDPDKWKEVK